MWTMLYNFSFYVFLPIICIAIAFICKQFVDSSPKTNSNELTDLVERKDRAFTIQIITLFTGVQISRVCTSAADILGLAEEICQLCEKSVGTLRLLSDGVIIDPWCKSWKNMTFGDLKVFGEKTMFVYFLPMEHDEILGTLGPDGIAEAWAEGEQKLRISKRLSKKLQEQCAKVEKEKMELHMKNSQVLQEKQKLVLKHGDLANEFACSKKRHKTQTQTYRNEMKKIQSEKRNFQKKVESTSAKLQETLLENDRLTTAERKLGDKVDHFKKDRLLFQKQHEQIIIAKEETEKDNQYLLQRLKSLSYANSSSEVSGHHHHHHHHHHLPDFSYRPPSSTPSETGNESFQSLPLTGSDHSAPQISDGFSSPWSSASSAETSTPKVARGDGAKLTIIDDSHYASPTTLPDSSLDETSHRFKDAERYEVPSFMQKQTAAPFMDNQPNPSPKGYAAFY